jgi:hypothetical protein
MELRDSASVSLPPFCTSFPCAGTSNLLAVRLSIRPETAAGFPYPGRHFFSTMRAQPAKGLCKAPPAPFLGAGGALPE